MKGPISNGPPAHHVVLYNMFSEVSNLALLPTDLILALLPAVQKQPIYAPLLRTLARAKAT